MHYLSSVYFVNQPLHVSGMFVAHHQEVHCIYIYIYIYTTGLLAGMGSRPTHSQLQSTTCPNCCIYIYTVYHLMMGYKYARNMYRLTDEIN